MLEKLLRQTSVHLSGFLCSAVEPAMHRDFMYAAKNEFPTHSFTPISNYKGRLLKVITCFSLVIFIYNTCFLSTILEKIPIFSCELNEQVEKQ